MFDFALKIALEVESLLDAKRCVLSLGKLSRHIGRDLAGIGEHVVFVELKERVELLVTQSLIFIAIFRVDASARPAISSAAVFPVTAQCSLF